MNLRGVPAEFCFGREAVAGLASGRCLAKGSSFAGGKLPDTMTSRTSRFPSLAWLAGLLLSLCASAPAAKAEGVTFIAVSDTHYAVPDPAKGGDRNEGKRAILSSMNTIGGKAFPAALKGAVVGKPRGVLVAGDLINGGRDAAKQLQLWAGDFGLTGGDGAVLKLPVYETWGNHDGGKLVPGFIEERNRKRVGLTAVSPGPGDAASCYSWDWGPLHLVCVGMYPGDANESKHKSSGYDPRKSLEFLKADLAKSVGGSGRPVLIMQHLNLPSDSNEWWSAAQRDAYAAVLKDYNVVAIVVGHEAGGLWKWNGIDVLGCNDINGGYWVVQIEGKRMVAARTKNGDVWNTRAVLDKHIGTGTPGAR